jgi:eukaryotic-like serine/threonine-protein kinase
MITLPRGTYLSLLLAFLLVSSSFPGECAGWTIKFAGSNSDPVVVDGVLYVGSADGAIYALDPANGATRWRFQTGDGLSSGPEIITMPKKGAGPDEMTAQALNAPREKGRRSVDLTPTVRNGTVFIGAGDFSFYALDASTGGKKWSYAAGSKIFGSAVYEDDTALVVTEKGLHALDASTGQKKWLFETLQEVPLRQMNDVRNLGKRPAQGPVRGENTLFLTAWPFMLSTTPQKSFVYAVAPDSGMTRWTTALDGLDITAPVVAKGLVLVAVEDPRLPSQPGHPLGVSANRATLYAINALDGQIKWKLGAERMYGTSRLLIAGDTIYFQTDKALIAADLATGQPLWSFSAENIQGDPKVDDRHLYVVTHKRAPIGPDDTVRALAIATGRERWSLGLGGGAASLRMVHEGVVYVGGSYLYAIDGGTGTRSWSFKGHSARLVSGGRVFLVSPTVEYIGSSRVDQGYLHALDAKTGKP